MSTKIPTLLGLRNIVSPQILRKGVTKLNPKLGKFFSGSEGAGYGLGAILSFLNSEITGRSEDVEGEATYKRASREIKRRKDLPKRLLKTAGDIGVGAVLGGLTGTAVKGLGSVAKAGVGAAALGGGMAGEQEPQQPQDFTQQVDIPPQQELQEQQPQEVQQEQEQPQEVSMLDTLRGIDGVLATEVEAMLGENLSPHEMEKALKTSRSFLQRTLNAERKLKMPMSRILETIQGVGMQQAQGTSSFQDALKIFMDRMK